MNVDLFKKLPAAPTRDVFGNRPAAWPTTRAERGKYYMLPDPAHPGDQIVVTSYDTWVDFGTQLETARRAGVNLDKKVKELLAEKQILVAQASDFKSRLEAIQEIRRKEKREKSYLQSGV